MTRSYFDDYEAEDALDAPGVQDGRTPLDRTIDRIGMGTLVK
jgi:hypothetical protein